MAPDERKQTRRLTTIFAADVVGYSRLMATDEEEVVRTLKARRQVVDALIARHEGRIFNTAGDSVVAEFGSAVEAVRCAITVQDELRVRNAELPEDRQMRFRIGINVGDVLVDGDDLLGDGVNVAARLEGLADAGGVCISGSVYELVRNKLSYGFEDLGPQQVKNIPDPVSAFRLRAGVPVEVAHAPGVAAGGDASPSRRRLVAALTGVAVLIAAGAAFLFMDAREEPAHETITAVVSTSLPAATRGSAAAPVAAGMRVGGISRVTNRPFRMNLGVDGAAGVEIELPDGGTARDTGEWWLKDAATFCVRFSRFGSGNTLCRSLRDDDGTTYAVAGDGKDDWWEISR